MENLLLIRVDTLRGIDKHLQDRLKKSTDENEKKIILSCIKDNRIRLLECFELINSLKSKKNKNINK